jgi:membrane-associated phospholipid phosphatase
LVGYVSEKLQPDSGSELQRSAQRHLLAAAICGALGFAAFFVDFPVYQFLQSHPPPGDLKRLIMLSEFFGFGGTAALVILVACVLDRRGWRVAATLLASTYGAGLAANGVKALVARQRPSVADPGGTIWATFYGWLPVITERDGWNYSIQSLPSGHAATAVGLALGLSHLYPRGRVLFALFAAMAALQRVVVGAHFVSDVLFGGALACGVFALGELVLARRFFAKRSADSIH